MLFLIIHQQAAFVKHKAKTADFSIDCFRFLYKIYSFIGLTVVLYSCIRIKTETIAVKNSAIGNVHHT